MVLEAGHWRYYWKLGVRIVGEGCVGSKKVIFIKGKCFHIVFWFPSVTLPSSSILLTRLLSTLKSWEFGPARHPFGVWARLCKNETDAGQGNNALQLPISKKNRSWGNKSCLVYLHWIQPYRIKSSLLLGSKMWYKANLFMVGVYCTFPWLLRSIWGTWKIQISSTFCVSAFGPLFHYFSFPCL